MEEVGFMHTIAAIEDVLIFPQAPTENQRIRSSNREAYDKVSTAKHGKRLGEVPRQTVSRTICGRFEQGLWWCECCLFKSAIPGATDSPGR